ncbi:MAG: hypothetical protein IKM06_02990 [Clostridia bacterium]|nr:hypothetical protein [Clostridia bacterium]
MDKKWIYFIQLSNHMWDDGNGKQRYWYPELDPDAYTPNNNVDLEVWDRVIKRAAEKGYNTLLIDLGDAVQYRSHPEIAAPDALTVDELKALLDKARGYGFSLIPKLNFSTDHHCWMKKYRRMVSSDIYREVCVDLINEVCELFDHPELFHLGMDEEHSFDCIQWREIAIMRGEKLMFEDFGIMFDAVRKNGARPWVWADYYWNHPDIFMRNMPKDVVLSNWFYVRFQNFPESDYHYKCIQAFKVFEEAGFDQIPTCSTCGSPQNPAETLLYMPTVISDEHLLGYCMAPWIYVTEENENLLMDSVDRLYHARKTVCPETLK